MLVIQTGDYSGMSLLKHLTARNCKLQRILVHQ